MEINKTMLGITAGVAGTLFLGYCLYFDQQRRKDPNYKKKVQERRKRTKKPKNDKQLPNLVEKDAVQQFFLQEVQLGEQCISNGEIDKSVEHFANAVIVCGQPSQLLQVLQQTLPTNVFMLLVEKIKLYSETTLPKLDDMNELE